MDWNLVATLDPDKHFDRGPLQEKPESQRVPMGQ